MARASSFPPLPVSKLAAVEWQQLKSEAVAEKLPRSRAVLQVPLSLLGRVGGLEDTTEMHMRQGGQLSCLSKLSASQVLFLSHAILRNKSNECYRDIMEAASFGATVTKPYGCLWYRTAEFVDRGSLLSHIREEWQSGMAEVQGQSLLIHEWWGPSCLVKPLISKHVNITSYTMQRFLRN